MKAVLQRVKSAEVEIATEVTGQIASGLLIYICFEAHDTKETLNTMVNKIVNLRIFGDEDSKMNNNILQVKGEILSISQFTLSWDGKKGHRPSFDKSMAPNQAKLFYRSFNDELSNLGIKLQKGRFAADMQVTSVNDGPVTFYLSF